MSSTSLTSEKVCSVSLQGLINYSFFSTHYSILSFSKVTPIILFALSIIPNYAHLPNEVKKFQTNIATI